MNTDFVIERKWKHLYVSIFMYSILSKNRMQLQIPKNYKNRLLKLFLKVHILYLACVSHKKMSYHFSESINEI